MGCKPANMKLVYFLALAICGAVVVSGAHPENDRLDCVLIGWRIGAARNLNPILFLFMQRALSRRRSAPNVAVFGRKVRCRIRRGVFWIARTSDTNSDIPSRNRQKMDLKTNYNLNRTRIDRRRSSNFIISTSVSPM